MSPDADRPESALRTISRLAAAVPAKDRALKKLLESLEQSTVALIEERDDLRAALAETPTGRRRGGGLARTLAVLFLLTSLLLGGALAYLFTIVDAPDALQARVLGDVSALTGVPLPGADAPSTVGVLPPPPPGDATPIQAIEGTVPTDLAPLIRALEAGRADDARILEELEGLRRLIESRATDGPSESMTADLAALGERLGTLSDRVDGLSGETAGLTDRLEERGADQQALADLRQALGRIDGALDDLRDRTAEITPLATDLAALAARVESISGRRAAPPAATAPTPANTGTLVHVTGAGETLRGIADQYGVDSAALAEANGAGARDLDRPLEAGQRVTIPR